MQLHFCPPTNYPTLFVRFSPQSMPVFRTFFLVDPFWPTKITTNPHILSHVNIELPDDWKPKLEVNISGLIIGRYERICDNALHSLRLIKLNVARFVGTGSFLLEYSNIHTK
jgi:hypothetical protein